jgi:hypothetical protein
MAIRLKVVRRQEEHARKVKELMEMFKLNPTSSYSNSYYQYQPTGASTSIIDPKIQETKELFEVFYLA